MQRYNIDIKKSRPDSNNAWCSYRRQAHIEGGIVMVGGIILGIACVMYAGAVIDMEEAEMEQENK